MNWKSGYLLMVGVIMVMAISYYTHKVNEPRVRVKQGPSGSRIAVEGERLVRDLKEGEKVCSSYFFTTKGDIFVFPTITPDRCSVTIWKEGNRVIGELHEDPERGAKHTGYSEVPEHCFPVTVVN